MDGYSTTEITIAVPSVVISISLKKPDSYKPRISAVEREASKLSPTWTGKKLKIAPAEIRCKPLTRISVTKKDS